MPSLKIGSSDRQDDQKCEKCALGEPISRDPFSTTVPLVDTQSFIAAFDHLAVSFANENP